MEMMKIKKVIRMTMIARRMNEIKSEDNHEEEKYEENGDENDRDEGGDEDDDEDR